MGENKLVGRASLIERAWIWSVIGYSVLRFVIAWAAFGDHGANVWVFGLIDVGTAWPYAKAVAAVCRHCAHSEWRRLAPASLVAIVMFLAPYAYLWVAAPSVSGSVRSGLAIFIAIMAVAVAIGLYRRVQLLKHEVQSSTEDQQPVPVSSVAAAASTAPTDSVETVIDLRDGAPEQDEVRSHAPKGGGGRPPTSTLRLAIGRFDDRDIIPARIMQAEVYMARDFTHETQRVDDFGAFIDDWSRQSVHFALYDGARPVGHARLIAPGPKDIPVRSCFDLDTDVPGVWEWSAHAKAEGAPRAASMQLARHVISFLQYNNIGEVALVCEPAMARLFQRTSGSDDDSAVVALCAAQYTWGAMVAPHRFDLERSDPKAREHFTSSRSARKEVSEILPAYVSTPRT